MLPNWIKQVNDHTFEMDADIYYPQTLDELGITEPDQHDLEVVHNFMKLDAQVAVKSARLWPKGKSVTFHIRGGPGFKDRWGQANFPEGKYAEVRARVKDSMTADREVAATARHSYKELRGYIPV